MSLQESGLTYKNIDDMLIASIRFCMHQREEVTPKLQKLSQHCKDYICGPAFIVYHWGTEIKPFDVEVGFPVTHMVEADEIESRILEGAEALTLLHHGSDEEIGKSAQKLYGYLAEHGIISAPQTREIFLNINPDHPEDNMKEIQAILHGWEDRFAKNLEQILGVEAREAVTKGLDEITLESSVEDRAKWIQAAIHRLDERANDNQKYQVLSSCAHIFSQERIANLKSIYERNNDIDEILAAMRKDPDWYESPVREGHIIYVGKIPYNRKEYEAAKTAAEKKRHYCHCSMIRDFLDEVSSTFCYCGAGWYRQQWEGILGKPVRVEILKALTKGDDECYFAIHIPPESVHE